jgi:DNA mismatch endonuclease, patch repair protein
MDIFTVKKRSEIMSRIRSTGTVPEERLYQIAKRLIGNRRAIHRNPKTIEGTPDVFIPSLKLAVFLDGCFFHGCPLHGHIPKTNIRYWERKTVKNKKRDRRIGYLLRRQGISVWRFWEHEMKPKCLPLAIKRLERAIEKQLQKPFNSHGLFFHKYVGLR